MSALALLEECRRQGVRVHRRGTELRWKLRQAKPELLGMLPDRSKRTIVHFRMRGDDGWATAIAPVSVTVAAVKRALRERHGDAVEFEP